MDLYIPINYKEKKYTSYELGKLKAGVIADATEEMAKNGAFAGMLKLVSGTLKSLSTEDGEEVTKDFTAIINRATVQTVEIISLKALTQDNDEGIEQISTCPRCKNKRIFEDVGEEDDSDYERNALHFSDLEILPYTGDQIIPVTLEDPISIKSKGEVLVEVSEIDFRYPTLSDAIKGNKKVADNKDARKQYAVYAQSIVHVNGEDVDQSFISSWGMWVMERMCISDIEKISKAMKSCGIKKTVKRECLKCGKKWSDPIDLSGFFETGLQL